MMAPRFPRVVGGVAGDGCYLRATRGRLDVVLNCGFVEDGLDELTPRYIFFTAVENSSSHPHFAVVSTALFFHCCSSARFLPILHEQGCDEEGEVCRRRRRRRRG